MHSQQESLLTAMWRATGVTEHWLEKFGGSVDHAAMANHLRISQGSLTNKVQTYKVFRVSDSTGSSWYPLWQLGYHADPVDGLTEVLVTLRRSPYIHSDWTKLRFFVESNPYLRINLGLEVPITPVEALRFGYINEVVDSAQIYLSHGAT